MSLADILVTLARHEVRCIAVGGIAAVLRGAPITTRDVDIVYDIAEDNIARLMAALTELDAFFRVDPRKLRPNESHLRSTGHKLLRTKFGLLDVLGTIEDATRYHDLSPHASALDVKGVPVLVLSVERLIEVKRKLARPQGSADAAATRELTGRASSERVSRFSEKSRDRCDCGLLRPAPAESLSLPAVPARLRDQQARGVRQQR